MLTEYALARILRPVTVRRTPGQRPVISAYRFIHQSRWTRTQDAGQLDQRCALLVDVAQGNERGPRVLQLDDVVRFPLAAEERGEWSTQPQQREPSFPRNRPDPVSFEARWNVRTEEDIDGPIVVHLRPAVLADRRARTILEHRTADGVIDHDGPEQAHRNTGRQVQPVDVPAVEVFAGAVARSPEVLRRLPHDVFNQRRRYA